MLEVPERTVYHYVYTDRLAAYKPGADLRIFRADVEALKAELEGRFDANEPPEGSLNVDEMAEWWGYHPESIRRMTRTVGLPARRARSKNGELYFLKDEVMGWLRSRAKK